MGEYYRLVRDDVARIYTPGDVVYVKIKVYDTDGNLVSPSGGVTAYLYNPCGDEVESQTMTETATGIYELNFNPLPSSYKFGKWRLRFKATYSSITNYLESFIVVLPTNSNFISEVRILSGIDSKKQIDDEQLSLMIWHSWEEATREAYNFIEETPLSNPTTGALWDDSNKIFQLSTTPLADVTGDGVVKGWGESSCATDIDGYWVDSDGAYHQLKISVISDEYGTVRLTQTDGSALPSDLKILKVRYYTKEKTFDEYLFYEAVSYLAAHKALVKLQYLNATTMADIASNERRILMSPQRMYKEYRRILRLIRKPTVGGV